MIEQRTEEWFKQRLGKVTASRISDVIAKTKTGVSTSRQNYLVQLVSERITGKKGDSFVNQAMLDGIERESAARELYMQTRGTSVTEVGFFDHPIIKNSGVSPERGRSSYARTKVRAGSHFVRSCKPRL